MGENKRTCTCSLFIPACLQLPASLWYAGDQGHLPTGRSFARNDRTATRARARGRTRCKLRQLGAAVGRDRGHLFDRTVAQ
jgi:hypothetical protein